MAAPLMQILRQKPFFSPFQGLKVLYSRSSSKYYSKTTQISHQRASLAQIQPQNETSFFEEEPKEFLDDDYFGVKKLVSVKSLYNVKAHLGHKTGCRDPYMAPFLFGTRFDLDIIDLEQTKVMMQDALNFAAHIAYRGGVILFVSRYRQTLDFVEQTAKDCGEYAHCRYWRGGSFTNSNVIYGGATRLPDLCIFVSVLNSVFETHTGVIDSAKLLIPTIGIVDTNCDPRLISYPIPANDDTPVAIKLYCELFKHAILAGKAKRKKNELVN